jgi:hypothetical protein
MTTLNFKMTTPINHKESEFKVFKTYDLDIFNIMKQNRPLNPSHVSRVETNIKAFGMLCNPIIVNENMEVIDGQHRLSASKRLKTFVYYIIVSGYDLENVKALNIVGQKWTSLDYLNSFANDGMKDYVLIRKFMNKHEVFGISICILLCSQTRSDDQLRNNSSKISTFKKGLYKIGDLKIAETYAIKLKQIEPFFSRYKDIKFASALIGLFLDKPDEFRFKEFINKLKLQPTKLIQCSTRQQYKEIIEEIYNYRRQKKVNLRF